MLCRLLVPPQISLYVSGISRAEVASEFEVLIVLTVDVALQVAGIAGLVGALPALEVPLLLVDRLDVIVEVQLPVAHVIAACAPECVPHLAASFPATTLAAIILQGCVSLLLG